MDQRHKFIKLVISIFPIIIFLCLWEVTARAAATPLFPAFSNVLKESYILIKNGVLLKNFLPSFVRVVVGYLLGCSAGIVVGTFMGINRFAEYTLSPLISFLFPIPTLGWLPLLMLWIGINEALPITLIFICAFFPVAYNTHTGIKEVKKEYTDTARTLGASPGFILVHVIFPLAAPNIFTGLRMESGMVWRTVIAAEMFAIPNGIGSLLMNAESLLRVDIIMVCLLLLSIVCTFFERSLLWLENKTTGAWR